ncbi:MAG: hypothetical protein J6U40_08110 [Kiritimatiellae bacterium]|nr:hypothetical protein [Kiritimatiellia bacterium]MBP5321093.1 hypothetical protein [Kiritimatiellia bacterium]
MDKPADHTPDPEPLYERQSLRDALAEYLLRAMGSGESGSVAEGLATYLAHSALPPFSNVLREMIRTARQDPVALYKKINMDRKLFSKLSSNPAYHPNKQTVLVLALALELSIRKTEYLLESAGFSLSRNSKADLIIRFFIDRKNYNILLINEMLYDFGQPLLPV